MFHFLHSRLKEDPSAPTIPFLPQSRVVTPAELHLPNAALESPELRDEQEYPGVTGIVWEVGWRVAVGENYEGESGYGGWRGQKRVQAAL